MRRRVAALALLLGGLAGLAAPSAAQKATLGGQFRYWAFNNHNDLRDVLGYWAKGPLHVQLEYWDFVRGQDVFRPEIGLHLRDRRRSVTTLQWRHERRRQDRFTLGTDQVLNDRWVARAEVSPIVTPDSTEWVVSGGLDFYWASYSFAQVTVIRDPRGDGLWVVPLRVRLQEHRANPVCAACHATMDPIGFALENFDAVGASRLYDSAGERAHARLGGRHEGPMAEARRRAQQPLRFHRSRQHDLHDRVRARPAAAGVSAAVELRVPGSRARNGSSAPPPPRVRSTVTVAPW